ncbi:hypothetical protein ABZ684_04755 [Streptomyces sp. NPDC006995]|uniref:hypothetical protein n=1 Tax=Streptomyces sp. NPDC006995 TaxID=3156907 RepID=UPI0033C64186
MTTKTAWPENVIARYLTVAGSSLGRDDIAVDIAERPGYYGIAFPTEHFIACHGCGDTRTEDWGWDAHHDEFGNGPQPDFDATGESALPAARKWAQEHAETCRAIPKPA